MNAENIAADTQENELTRCRPFRLFMVMIYDATIIVGLFLIAGAIASPLDQGNQQALKDPLFTLYLAAVWFAYLAYSWRRGMTVGMRAWKVRLLADTGQRPTLMVCLKRFAVSLASAACLGLGFAWMWFDREGRNWHDIASRTGVYLVNKSN